MIYYRRTKTKTQVNTVAPVKGRTQEHLSTLATIKRLQTVGIQFKAIGIALFRARPSPSLSQTLIRWGKGFTAKVHTNQADGRLSARPCREGEPSIQHSRSQKTQCTNLISHTPSTRSDPGNFILPFHPASLSHSITQRLTRQHIWNSHLCLPTRTVIKCCYTSTRS